MKTSEIFIFEMANFYPGLNELTHWSLIMHVYTSVNGSSLYQVMAWHLFDAKPLPVPILMYSPLDP